MDGDWWLDHLAPKRRYDAEMGALFGEDTKMTPNG
jgi:hypothetical protein